MHAKAPDGPEIDPVRGRAEAVIGSDIGMSTTPKTATVNDLCKRSHGGAGQRQVYDNKSLLIR
jgi:hypothetical protein